MHACASSLRWRHLYISRQHPFPERLPLGQDPFHSELGTGCDRAFPAPTTSLQKRQARRKLCTAPGSPSCADDPAGQSSVPAARGNHAQCLLPDWPTKLEGSAWGLGLQHRENKTLQVILAVDGSLIQRNRFRRKCPRGQSVGPAALCDRPQEREVTLGSRWRHVGDPAAQVSHCPERLSRGQPWAESHFLIRKGPLRAGRDVDP